MGRCNSGTRNQDVVLSLGIVRIHAERILVADITRVDGAEHAVRARRAIVEVPLPGEDLQHLCILGNIDQLRPCEEAGASIAMTPTVVARISAPSSFLFSGS